MRVTRYRFLLFVAVALALGLAPAQASAAEVRSGQSVTIGPDEVVDDDLYVFGGIVTVQGQVTGDLIVSGGTTTVAGMVEGDVLAAGGTTTISGSVGGSVRAAGGSITIDGSVANDVVAGGGSLSLGPDARVGRDVLIGAGSANLAGPIGRNVRVGAGELTIGGTVGGDVEGNVDRLRLAEGAQIQGDLVYTSDREAEIAPGAAVHGRTQRHVRAPEEPGVRVWDAVLGWLRTLVGLLLLGLVAVLLFPGFAMRSARTLGGRPWASLGVGFGLLVGVPIAAILVFGLGIFVGGWWLGLIVLALYGIALALSYVVAGVFVGHWLLGRIGRDQFHLAWALLIGLVVLLLVSLVPFVGGILVAIALLFGLGALALAVVGARRAMPSTG